VVIVGLLKHGRDLLLYHLRGCQCVGETIR